MNKTAATVLQELMMKSGDVPEFECIAQSGPQHSSTFEYRCKAHGVSVRAKAKSKKIAKQEAARRMLNQLHVLGISVPLPFARLPSPDPPSPPSPASPSAKALPSTGAPSSVDVHSYVALLKELCVEYNLGAVEYELVGDSGPAHQRLFTISAALGRHTRLASATTKKQARQQAAEMLYSYLRENLARLTNDFVEDEAMARAHEKAMERYVETRSAPRLDLGQKLADYHLGLMYIDADKLVKAREEMRNMTDAHPITNVHRVGKALGLKVSEIVLEGNVFCLQLEPCFPTLVVAGRSSEEAARAGLRYLRRAVAYSLLA